MTRAQHTPGPWRVDCDGLSMAGQIVVTASHLSRDDASYDEAKANLRLIAAAPDLLAALDGLLNCVDGQHDPDWLDRCKAEARAAIAKAEAK